MTVKCKNLSFTKCGGVSMAKELDNNPVPDHWYQDPLNYLIEHVTNSSAVIRICVNLLKIHMCVYTL